MKLTTIILASAMALSSTFALAQGATGGGTAGARSGHAAKAYHGVGSPGPGGGVADNRGYGSNGSPDGPTSLSGAGPSTTGGGSAGGGSSGGGGGNGR